MQSLINNGRSFIPSKIICIGRNYVEHIRELNNELPAQMVLFSKPNSAISTKLNSNLGEPLHYELELCFVFDDLHFSAVGLGLDLTKRTLQSQLKSKGLPWERAKAFDGSALFSDFIALPNDLAALRFELTVDGVLRQQGCIDLMLYKPDEILNEIQSFMTLNQGDIVMTGTPKGVDVINRGEIFNAKLYYNDELILTQKWQAI